MLLGLSVAALRISLRSGPVVLLPGRLLGHGAEGHTHYSQHQQPKGSCCRRRGLPGEDAGQAILPLGKSYPNSAMPLLESGLFGPVETRLPNSKAEMMVIMLG